MYVFVGQKKEGQRAEAVPSWSGWIATFQTGGPCPWTASQVVTRDLLAKLKIVPV